MRKIFQIELKSLEETVNANHRKTIYPNGELPRISTIQLGAISANEPQN